MDLQSFKQWARRSLGQGECGVRVELDDRQLDQALDDAKEWFNAYIGLYREASLSLVAEQVEYDLSAITPRVDTVTKVWFPSHTFQIDYATLYPGFLDIQGIPYGDAFMSGVGYPQTTIVQSLQTQESVARVLSADLDWEIVVDKTQTPAVCKLRIMPAPTQSGTAIYFYRVDPRDVKLSYYKQRDMFLIREYALAKAKYMLGRIRGKYTGGLPAAGGDRSLDGESLISESREDIMRLEEKIMSYDGPVMPVVG